MAKLNFEKLQLEISGASHDDKIVGRIFGVPKNLTVDFDYIEKQLRRRKGGKAYTTRRAEADKPVFVSGVSNGKTDGNVVEFYIENQNFDSKPYLSLASVPRPSHADYPALVKYGKLEPGGGVFSGRLTAILVVAGAIFKQFLEDNGVNVVSHVSSIGTVCDDKLDSLNSADEVDLKNQDFPVINGRIKEKYLSLIEETRLDGDSVGGTVECKISGLPAGLGNVWFNSSESMLSEMLFAVPAVKGVEFGKGFALSEMTGSEANDPYGISNGKIVATENDNGGILGGLTTGMPVLFRVAFKPTPSIAKEQDSVDYIAKTPCKISISGKHDPCIVARAAPVIEAVAEFWAAELLLEGK